MKSLANALIAVLAMAGVAEAACAQDVVALSPEAREQALQAAAEAPEPPINGAPTRRIHGTMGVEIGSNGYHALYGTTVVPLGQTGTASFSFVTAGMSGRYRH